MEEIVESTEKKIRDELKLRKQLSITPPTSYDTIAGELTGPMFASCWM